MTPQAELEKLLRALFSPDELTRWLRAHPDTQEIADLVAPGAAVNVVFDAVQALDRRGLVDAAFFDRLVAERKRREADIRAVQAAWSAEAPATRLDPHHAAARAPGTPVEKVQEAGDKLKQWAKVLAGAAAGIPVLIKVGMEVRAAFVGPTIPPVEPPPVVVDAPGPVVGDAPGPDAAQPPATHPPEPDPGPTSPGVTPPGDGSPSGPAGSPAPTCVSLDAGPSLTLPARLPPVVAVYSDGSLALADHLSWTVEPANLAEIRSSDNAIIPTKIGDGSLIPSMDGCTGRVSVHTANPMVNLSGGLMVGASQTLPEHPIVSANGFEGLALSGVSLSWSIANTTTCKLESRTKVSGVAEGTCELRVRSTDHVIDQTLSLTVFKFTLGAGAIERIDRQLNLAPAPHNSPILPQPR